MRNARARGESPAAVGAEARRRAGPRAPALTALALACLLAGCLPVPEAAEEVPPVPEGPFREAVLALREVRGAWQGELVIRDRSHRRLVRRTLRVGTELARDGMHMIIHRQEQRPGSTLRTLAVTHADPRNGALLIAAFDAGSLTGLHYRIRRFERVDAWNWTLVADGSGEAAADGEAASRITLTRGGDRLSWREDVRRASGEFAVRTLLTLEREVS